MTNLRAFVFAFIVLTIQTIILLIWGYINGKSVALVAILFLIVDSVLIGIATELKIYGENK